MMSLPPNFLSATDTIALVRSGVLSVEDVARAHLDRVQERDAIVNAWVYLDPEMVLNEARRLDALPVEQRGPLHGVLLGVKDMIQTIDMPTEYNSVLYKDHFPNVDAAPVLALRSAGALIMGKTTTTEFAGSTRGTETCNPVDPTRTPGGSSSGSAAAVADYQVHIALGTQTLGNCAIHFVSTLIREYGTEYDSRITPDSANRVSIFPSREPVMMLLNSCLLGSTIRPASYNGCFSMKPTWGAISREGLKVFSVSLDTLGIFARSVQDLSLLADIFQLADSDIPPPSKPLSELKIGVAKTVHWPAAEPSSRTALQHAVELLIKGGVEVEEVDLGEEFDQMKDVPTKIMFSEARAAMLGEYLYNQELLHDEFRAHVENRTNISREDQLAAYDLAAKLRPVFDQIASKYDAILTPSAIGEAPSGLDYTGDPRFCSLWTVLHAPVINIPGFAGEHGMPVGLTLVNGRYKDRKLLKVAAVVAEAIKDAGGDQLKRPPVPHAGKFHATSDGSVRFL